MKTLIIDLMEDLKEWWKSTELAKRLVRVDLVPLIVTYLVLQSIVGYVAYFKAENPKEIMICGSIIIVLIMFTVVLVICWDDEKTYKRKQNYARPVNPIGLGPKGYSAFTVSEAFSAGYKRALSEQGHYKIGHQPTREEWFKIKNIKL